MRMKCSTELSLGRTRMTAFSASWSFNHARRLAPNWLLSVFVKGDMTCAPVCAVQLNLLAALARPDAKVRDQESEAIRHTGARPDRDAATMRYFLYWLCRTLSWPRPHAILLTLSTESFH